MSNLHEGRFARAEEEGDLVVIYTRQPGGSGEVTALSLSCEMGDIPDLLNDLDGIRQMIADHYANWQCGQEMRARNAARDGYEARAALAAAGR